MRASGAKGQMPARMLALWVHGNFEGADSVLDDAEAGEELGEGDEGAEWPVFAFDEGDGSVALGGVAEVTGFAFGFRGARVFFAFFSSAAAAFFRSTAAFFRSAAAFFFCLSTFVGHSMLMQITQGLRPVMRTFTIGWPHASHR